jgi:hypothetical protein
MVPHRPSSEAKLKCREVEFRALSHQKLSHPARAGDVMPAAPPRRLFEANSVLFLDASSILRWPLEASSILIRCKVLSAC